MNWILVYVDTGQRSIAMINSVAMKVKQIIIPFTLQKLILDYLHSNHMGIEKMQLLVRG